VVQGVELEEEAKEAQIHLCECQNGMYIKQSSVGMNHSTFVFLLHQFSELDFTFIFIKEVECNDLLVT
jgi:hypothetical protein